MELPKFYETEIVRNEKLTDSIFLLEAKLPEGKLNFKSGQFALTYKETSQKEENRAYSICSSPSKETIEFLIKLQKDGKVSPLLYQLKKGDKLKVRAPFGVFLIKEPLPEEIIFIAGGTGIAPFRSMIHDILEKNHKTKITLIFGFRHETDFLFREEFQSLKKNHENFKGHYALTEPTSSWTDLKGRVTDVIPQILTNTENKHIYICGPNPMINNTLSILINNLNFKKEQVHFERWSKEFK